MFHSNTMRYLRRVLIHANIYRSGLMPSTSPLKSGSVLITPTQRFYAKKVDEFEVDPSLSNSTEAQFFETDLGSMEEGQDGLAENENKLEVDQDEAQEDEDADDLDEELNADSAETLEREQPIPLENSFKAVPTDKKQLLKDRYHDLFLELYKGKNTDLNIEDIEIESGRILNWKCNDCKKPFKKSVIERVFLTKECPHCAKADFRSLAKEHPNLAKEWAPLKNPMFMHPKHLSVHSSEDITWKCGKCSFEFESSVKQRCAGEACPRCYPKDGHWAALFPELAKEWHPLRNGDLKHSDLNEKADRLIWWMCPKCSYEYEESLRRRLHKNMGCPLCRQDFRDPKAV